MVKFGCPHCQHTIRLSEKYFGKRIRCPQCAQIIHVPIWEKDSQTPSFHGVPKSSDAPRNAPPAEISDLKDLMNSARSASDKPAKQNRCPRCNNVIFRYKNSCVTCGYTVPTQTPKDTQESAAPQTSAKTLLILAGGLAGALLAALTWGGLAFLAQMKLAFFAWIVGIAAGVGIMLLKKKAGKSMGFAAVLIAMLGIGMGKFLVVQGVTLPRMRVELKEAEIEYAKWEEIRITRIASNSQKLFHYACHEMSDRGHWDDQFPHDLEGRDKSHFVFTVVIVHLGLKPKGWQSYPQKDRIDAAVQKVNDTMKTWTLEEKKQCVRTHQKAVEEDMEKIWPMMFEDHQNLRPDFFKDWNDVNFAYRPPPNPKIAYSIAVFKSFSFGDILWFPLAFIFAYFIGSGEND
jgi:hypothetical protein